MNPFEAYVEFINDAYEQSDLSEFGRRVRETSKHVLKKTVFTVCPIIGNATLDCARRIKRELAEAYSKKEGEFAEAN